MWEQWAAVPPPPLFVLVSLIAAQGPSGGSLAGVRPPVVDVGYDTDVSTRRFEVLDVDFGEGRVLFHHIYRLTGDPSRELAPGVNCRYPGLGAGEGEVFGIYDVQGDRYDVVFPVHAPVRTEEACSTPEESALVEKTMKEHLLRVGLSLDARPPAIPPAPQGDYFPVPVKGRDRPVHFEVAARRATPEDLARDPALLGGEADAQIALARLEVQGRVLYTRYQALDSDAEVGREVQFLRVFLSDDHTRAIILERFYHRPKGKAPRSLFSFSPVLDLVPLLDGLEELPEDQVQKPVAKRRAEARSRPASPEDETCSEQCCSCGCLACLAPMVGGACGCALCVDGCSSLEKRLLGKDDDDAYGEEIPPPEDDDDNDGDGDGDEYVSFRQRDVFLF